MLMLKQKIAAWLLLCSLLPAQAQQSVVTIPSKNNSGNGSTTITSSLEFQQIWASQANPSSSGGSGQRSGCLVVNMSAARMWVYFQGPGMATPTAATLSTIKDLSIPLEAAVAVNAQGGYVGCGTGAGGALQDAVWIAGTATSKFFANRQ